MITQHNDDIRNITNLFTKYDWNIDMKELVLDRIKHFEKLKSIEVSRIKTDQLALLKQENDNLIIRQKEQLLNDKTGVLHPNSILIVDNFKIKSPVI